MSDQLSKVVEARQIIDEFIQCSSVGRSDGKLVSAAKDWLAATDRIESAAAPMEVDKVSELILSEYFADKRNGVGDYWARDMAKEAHEKIVTTLARQLAEAKAEIVALSDDVAEYQRNIDAESFALTKAESALAAATRRVAEVEGLVGKWRHEIEHMLHGTNPDESHAMVIQKSRCTDELEAAIKEPK